MNKSLLTTNKIAYVLPEGKELLKEVTLSIKEGDRIGLVGRNGTGKSTLMKILSGELKPTSGKVFSKSSIYYLPQLSPDLDYKEEALYQYISRYIDNWWEVLLILEREFKTKLDESISISKLSGGELIKLYLAIGLLQKPDILFLDEPTNHLDITAQEGLIEFVRRFDGAIVMTSHNRYFLDQAVKSIWALENGTVSEITGTYSEFQEQKDTKILSDKRKYEQEKRKIKQLKFIVQQKKSQAKSTDQKVLRDPYTKGLSGKKAKSAKILADKLEKTIEHVEKTLAHTVEKTSFLDLSETESSKTRTLFRIESAKLKLPNNETLIQDWNLKIRYGDRIAICGANGTGKTLLLKSLVDENSKLISGISFRADNLSYQTIDQKYDLVNTAKTMIENVQILNPKLNQEIIRRQLGNFQFKMDTEVNKKAKFLSGGEIAKLTFAMVTSKPLDLLILDEPTNNLDIETVDVIIQALNNFDGAIIVISHDINFLSRIRIEQSYCIANKQITMMTSTPRQEEIFHNELQKLMS